jgi:hypothetical protein
MELKKTIGASPLITDEGKIEMHMNVGTWSRPSHPTAEPSHGDLGAQTGD